MRVVGLMFMFYLYRLVRIPFEMYYDWEDPLLPKGSKKEDVMVGSEEEIRERLKYKRRVANWQSVG